MKDNFEDHAKWLGDTYANKTKQEIKGMFEDLSIGFKIFFAGMILMTAISYLVSNFYKQGFWLFAVPFSISLSLAGLSLGFVFWRWKFRILSVILIVLSVALPIAVMYIGVSS